MALSTFSELKGSLRNWLARPDIPDDVLEDAIAMAEDRHRRELRLRAMEKRQIATIPLLDIDGTPNRKIALPSQFAEMRRIGIFLADRLEKLDPVSQDQMFQYSTLAPGRPGYFAVAGDIEFDRPPDQSYQLEMVFFQGFQELSDSNPTNWLLQNARDLYLYGAWLHLGVYVGSELMKAAEMRYNKGAADLQYLDESGRWGGTLQARSRDYEGI